ncbi:MAG: DUF4404 family protein [Chromatiales bacterium]|nr:MAG: DUF4404 family protein [Chromatiales bacterium]
MPKERLRQLVNSLHEELERTPRVDAEGREMLRELTGDIEELVGHDAPSPESRDSATQRVETAALRLEAEHPRLAGILGEVMDALGRLGI